jgi:hypothetical protein
MHDEAVLLFIGKVWFCRFIALEVLQVGKEPVFGKGQLLLFQMISHRI